MRVRIKEDINLKDLSENNWNGCRSHTLSFLDKCYGYDRIFEVEEDEDNKEYYRISSYTVNKKCFEKVIEDKPSKIDEFEFGVIEEKGHYELKKRCNEIAKAVNYLLEKSDKE